MKPLPNDIVDGIMGILRNYPFVGEFIYRLQEPYKSRLYEALVNKVSDKLNVHNKPDPP